MKLQGRIMAAVLVLCMLFTTLYIGLKNNEIPAETEKSGFSNLIEKDTLYLWYTDESLTDYLNSVSLQYATENDIRIIPMQVSAVEYLESIHSATMEGKNYPDLFLVTNDSLEKAYLDGLAIEVSDPLKRLNEQYYPDTALHAVTYKDKKIAYPFYYETSMFLYNRTYLSGMADSIIKGEVMAPESEDGEPFSLDLSKVSGADDLIPTTIEDILDLADLCDAPDGVESFFKWDVNDVFYNYFFAGNYINVGGDNGDDSGMIDICNDYSVASLNVYQNLNQFFSIEAKEADYDSVLNDFISGKTVFTVATTDAIARIEQAKEEGSFTYEYGVTKLPDLNTDLKSRGLSVTNTIAINGYGKHKEEADEFAAWLSENVDQSLYERTGKISALKQINYDNPLVSDTMQAYENSASLPKIMQASNFWVQLEAAYTGIWEGEDIQTRMEALEEQMKSQIQDNNE